MVRLEKIKRNNNTIEACFFPEDSKKAGFIAIDIISGKTIGVTDAPGYEDASSYFHHARNRLLDLSQKKDIPEKCTVMWY